MESTSLKSLRARVQSTSSCFSKENVNRICFSLGSILSHLHIGEMYIWQQIPFLGVLETCPLKMFSFLAHMCILSRMKTQSKKEKCVQRGMIFPAPWSTIRKQSFSCDFKNGSLPTFSNSFFLNDCFSTELN
jgi:hypothetical protein